MNRYAKIKKRAKDAMGGERAFWIAGPTVRMAFVAREILAVLTAQDDDVPAERVRALMLDLQEWMDLDKELT